MEAVRSLGGHTLLLLLIQLALLVAAARLGGELARRLRLPSVIGELLGGIALGPSGLGHFFPGAQAAIFPAEAEQVHLIEVISNLGMIALLTLTGYETDIRLLRNLGRSALGASVLGMVIPFAFGLGLGLFVPESYLADPNRRMLFACFVATALAISAMPVIARILADLDLTRRNLGVVILSAGVVDDTTGWIILSIIAGAANASGFASLSRAVAAIVLTAAFMAFCAFVLYPAVRFTARFVRDHFRSAHSDLVLVLVVMLLCAAATDSIGVHSAFGAFLAGVVLRQVPRIDARALEPLEGMVGTLFAPVFFGVVGLKVDLWPVAGHSLLWVVLAVATAGKLIGVTVGALLGRMPAWEAFSIAVAMNARGAMGLVVASIGLSLGILNRDMFSVIVFVAVATSFMAPIMLRVTTRFVKPTEEEARRLAEASALEVFTKRRVLLATAGGPHAVAAARMAAGIAEADEGALTVLRVDIGRGLPGILRSFLRKGEQRATFAERLPAIEAQTRELGMPKPQVRGVSARDPADAIIAEASRDYGLVVLGGTSSGSPLSTVLGDVVARSPSHVLVVASRGEPEPRYRRLLVPVDGRAPSRAAAELAAIYAKRTGATVTIVHYEEHRPEAPGQTPAPATPPSDVLDRIAPALRALQVTVEVVAKQGSGVEPILEEVARGHDLLLLGVENRALQRRMFFGYDTERLINACPISVAILILR